MDVELTQEQIDRFRTDGFIQIDKITTDDEITWLRGLYDKIFEDRAGEGEGRFFDLGGKRGHDGPEVLPQMLAPEKHHPELRDTIYWRNAVRLANELLEIGPEDVTTVGSDMILKPAGYGRETPWHQDEAYWDPTLLYKSLSVWMPLEDAPVEAGCMHFVPGSHASDVVWHKHIDDDPTVHGLMTPDVPEGGVPCPVPAGGASLHHCRMLHYAGPNTTGKPRRAYIIRIMGPATKRETPQDRPWQRAAAQALAELREGR